MIDYDQHLTADYERAEREEYQRDLLIERTYDKVFASSDPQGIIDAVDAVLGGPGLAVEILREEVARYLNQQGIDLNAAALRAGV